MRKRSPGMKTRSKTTGAPAASYETRSDRNAGAAVGAREACSEEPRRHAFALGREVPGEAAELEDVVVDRRRRHERPEAVAPRDQVLALEQLQRLAEGHERDAEALGEPALGVEPGPGTERARANPGAQGVGDLVVAGDPTRDGADLAHPDLVLRISRCSRTP